MKMNVSITDLMDELCLDELGVGLDPAPVTAGQVMENLTDRRGTDRQALASGSRHQPAGSAGGDLEQHG